MKGESDCPNCGGKGGKVVGGFNWTDWRDCWLPPPYKSKRVKT